MPDPHPLAPFIDLMDRAAAGEFDHPTDSRVLDLTDSAIPDEELYDAFEVRR